MASVTSYDKDSGQVYTETVCKAGPMTADWIWGTRGSTHKYKHYKSRGLGCSPLIQMTIRSFLLHSSTLTSSSLEGLPWELASILWSSLVEARLESVRIWQIFVSAYPNVPPKTMQRKIERVNEPDYSLNFYTEPLLSPGLKWLAILTLQNLSVPRRSTLIQCLSRLINLAVLTIEKTEFNHSGSCVDDNLVREWTRHATESEDGKAFGELRVFNLGMQPAITTRSFGFLRSLPRLSVINMYDSGVDYHDQNAVKKAGWRWLNPDPSFPSAIFEDQCEHDTLSWDSVAHASLKLANTLEMAALPQKAFEAFRIPPCLHLMLGRSRPLRLPWPWRMRTFVRDPEHALDVHGQPKTGQKRLCNEDQSYSKTAQKKANLRPSTQPSMGDILRSFGL